MPINTDTIPAILAGLSACLGRVDGLHVHDYEATDLTGLPAAAIVLDAGERASVALARERFESETGRVDLLLAWTVRLFSAGDQARESELAGLGLLGDVVGAIDADETLGAAVRSASVSSISRERVQIGEGGREYLTFVVTVLTTSAHTQTFE